MTLIQHTGTAPIDLTDRRPWWLRLWRRFVPYRYHFYSPPTCTCGHGFDEHDDPWVPNPRNPVGLACGTCACFDYEPPK